MSDSKCRIDKTEKEYIEIRVVDDTQPIAFYCIALSKIPGKYINTFQIIII